VRKRSDFLAEYAQLATHEPRLKELHDTALQTPLRTKCGGIDFIAWEAIKTSFLYLVDEAPEDGELKNPEVAAMCLTVLFGDWGT